MKYTLLSCMILLAATPAFAAEKSSMWGSVGNQVLAHDTVTQMDTNGDGVISHDEFTAYQEKQFTAMDKNGDKSLSADEIGASKRKGIPGFK